MATKQIDKIKALSGADAQHLLERVAAAVTPTMARHGWHVERLEEFSPANAGLLGMNTNGGELIQIRLRRPEDGAFYEWEHILGTMVHELTHMELGPHNAAFYKRMDEIHDEVDQGDIPHAFAGEGRRLGGLKATNVRAVAAAAAQERANKSRLMAGSGQRLGAVFGGSSKPLSNEERRKLVVEAAEQRKFVTLKFA